MEISNSPPYNEHLAQLVEWLSHQCVTGPIVIKSLTKPDNYTMIPNLGYLFTLECGTRILKGTDGRLLQLVNNSDI